MFYTRIFSVSEKAIMIKLVIINTVIIYYYNYYTCNNFYNYVCINNFFAKGKEEREECIIT